MSDWIDAILFGVALVAFTLGMSSIVMGFMSGKEGSEALHERIEMGYLGVSGLVVSLLMLYVIG
ncbi:hypothetical protein ACFOEW_07765 [Alteromonas oceani]|jgi:hypothetical protein|uniref:Uncharacterized protein n=1 Tax=Alteromonas oceani TaxID=2071609 RepID=A0ABV7JUF2_9ALTE|nr:hypothetical protein [Alteromonas oceani]HAU92390.1 hypothetical protein [Alteromonas sp.]HCA76086.1 hypothetical protein [Alteromonas sp.]HCL11753.1 hypothetical protein [Alteromonas sp.]HCV16988.1 hypothetical protein [Alteromonas sp.]|tara:strand:+ start:60 stop:251 length:192 start_codon:yes stop_codon:yes gene_type:complete